MSDRAKRLAIKRRITYSSTHHLLHFVVESAKAYNAPNRIDTKFNLGSMNKMFTAVAVAQLVEQGKLSFEDTVGKILPDYPNKEVAEKVKIHHLLTHTSGLDDYF